MTADYHTLEIAMSRQGEAYQVELSHADPRSDARLAPLRGAAPLRPQGLLALQLSPEAYGRELSAQLFAEEAVSQRFSQVEAAAQAADASLRIRVRIDPSAQELQSLRWELLRHPATQALIATSERSLLSRFMVSRDWRPVALRARAQLSAVIAIAAPPPADLQGRGLAPVDFEGERARTLTALGGIVARTLGGPGSPLTLDALVASLREGPDVLYLVCHGMIGRSSGAPAIILQGEGGRPGSCGSRSW